MIGTMDTEVNVPCTEKWEVFVVKVSPLMPGVRQSMNSFACFSQCWELRLSNFNLSGSFISFLPNPFAPYAEVCCEQ